MITITNELLRSLRGTLAALAIVMTAFAGPSAALSQTAPVADEAARKGGFWVSTLYGPNSVGTSAAIRYGALGLGGSTFWFVGDTARGMPARPGGAFATFDMHLLWDVTSWLCLYGSASAGGRVTTYAGPVPLSDTERELSILGLGCGIQISLMSRFTMGGGWSGVFMPIKGEGADFRPIQQAVFLLGYRF